ncbi:unnamed protein product [Tilletia controversa]|uniref:Secreted protein n=3 Tax=Tilletia TaxID=13289 RepID=A0A8X7MLA4_9BASI|nr:hypothetical protein CF336_g7509 [Tilletia laevis]KAE8186797.1 hypothetical protein CF328_g7121 [Tilletia controversa]KAE8248054.1 hypothetical protein A4X03_0g6885 [Tilletia caries]KAE8188340.1 hypothetical protein CF335_g6923 [Tilletia laevis]KAE8240137.1 hypothetical protein A4X06_0g7894 [Tilletia controversa]
MKLLTLTAVLLISVSYAMAAIANPYSTIMCTALGEVGLTNLASVGCPDIPIIPTRINEKDFVCSALRNGGLPRLERLGCPSELRTRAGKHKHKYGGKKHPHKDEDRKWEEDGTLQFQDEDDGEREKVTEEPECNSEDICKVVQKAGFLGLNFGFDTCARMKRETSTIRRDEPECLRRSCEMVQKGLFNLVWDGCDGV